VEVINLKFVLYIISFTLIAGFLVACSNEVEETSINQTQNEGSDNNMTSYEDISPSDAKEKLDSNDNVVLLDVRTEEEYAESHIPKSVLIPVDELENRAESELKDKNAEILVYCRSGNRSVTASEILIDLGYSKVYNLGGIIDWPYDTETGLN
jgi:rhodanese-related sulfurtransferase